MEFDVVIIGAGAVGNAIAEELSRYQLSVAVIEKEYDTAFGISGRNSGVIHSGFNNRPGSLMAELCVKGCQGFAGVAERLGIDFKQTGKLVVALTEEDVPGLRKLYEQGLANGVQGLSIIDKDEIKRININYNGVIGLWSEMTGVFDPFAYTVALAEHAVKNGVKYYFGLEVTDLTKEDSVYQIKTSHPNRTLKARWVINSAGLHSDQVCRTAGIHDYVIHPCRGEYHILDKKIRDYVNVPVYPVPNEKNGGLGVHLTPTLSGNIMIGPSAEYIDEKEDYADTGSVMDQLFAEGSQLLPALDKRQCIRSFAGVRPKLTGKEQGGYADFVIKESERMGHFIILTGIESPGLTASIPIAAEVSKIIGRRESLIRKDSLNSDRVDILKGCERSSKGSQAMICRCEEISEMKVLEAYDRILAIGATPTLKGIKNRTRAGMGRCQGSFCTVRIVDLLEKQRGIDPIQFVANDRDSMLFSRRARP